MEIDTETFTVRDVRTGKTLQGRALPDIYRGIIEAGGEKAYLKQRLERERAGAA